MTVTHVKAHTRGKDDPLKPVMEARKSYYARKHGVELVGTDDARLSRPAADPAPGGPSLASIAAKLADLAKLMSNIGG